MSSTVTTVHLSTTNGDPVRFAPAQLVVAGYTGRDLAAVQHHIDELAAIGVPEPDSVPSFFELGVDRLTTAAQLYVDGGATSGEVEPVLLRNRGDYYLAVGSDHTDRELEREGIALSKAACPKPISSTVIDLGTDASAIDWDTIGVRSWVDETLYQDGTLASMLPIHDVLAMWDSHSSGVPDVAIFGGTLPLLDGTFRYGHEWRMQLSVPGQSTLELAYRVTIRRF